MGIWMVFAMYIIKDEIEQLKNSCNYDNVDTYPEKDLNRVFNNWVFLDKFEAELCEGKEYSLDNILYSKYYWCTQFKNKYNALCGTDVGLDQQQFKIIEQKTECLDEVDWDLIKSIEEVTK